MLALVFVDDLFEHAVLFVVLYGAAGAGFLLLVSAPAALRLRLVVLVALVLRLALLPSTPSLTTDHYRYVWDGRVQAAGHNPYVHAPGGPALRDVDYPDRERINHPGLRTFYPPLTEAMFAGVAALGGGILGLKVVLGIFELLTAVAVGALAGPRRRREALTLYLLCPLVILETWSSAHVEAPAVFLVVLSAALLVRGRDGWAGAALGLAAAFRLTPALLVLPAILGRRASLRSFLPAFALAWALPYVPYLLTGGAFGSLVEFREVGNSFMFSILDAVLPYEATRVLCAAAVVAGSVLIARRLPGREATAAAFAWTSTLLLLFMPVVHPWYWILPVALSVAAGLRLPLYLGLVGPLAEIAYAKVPAYRGWLHLVTYAPLLIGASTLVRYLRDRRKAASTTGR